MNDVAIHYVRKLLQAFSTQAPSSHYDHSSACEIIHSTPSRFITSSLSTAKAVEVASEEPTTKERMENNATHIFVSMCDLSTTAFTAVVIIIIIAHE
jgi:hypothetical protein